MPKYHHNTESWTDDLLSMGRYSFALEELRKAFPEQTETAIKFALKRLASKNKIVSIFKGYYVIIPPQYSSRGMLPPELFLDVFMKHLQRSYYLALLNAAAYHGASHQQPQEYFVMTSFPVMRPTRKKNLKINYISIKDLPDKLTEQHKTEAGYICISNPVLTAADLLQFEKRIGGISRAATVLNELAESIKPEDFNTELLNHSAVTALQRLGYILEFVCRQNTLADALFRALALQQAKLFRIPLKKSITAKGFSSDNRWKVIVNTTVETDD